MMVWIRVELVEVVRQIRFLKIFLNSCLTDWMKAVRKSEEARRDLANTMWHIINSQFVLVELK